MFKNIKHFRDKSIKNLTIMGRGKHCTEEKKKEII